MKIILSFLLIANMIGIFPQSFAMCAVNEDWPEAPCFDTIPVNRNEYREAWAPYYDYKGSEFMEQKRAELLQAVNDGTFKEWNNSAENSNVYNYYLSIDVVPNQYDFFLFDDNPRTWIPTFPQFVLITTIVAGAATLTVVVIRTFKK